MAVADSSPSFAALAGGVPGAPEAPIDPDVLTRLANAFFTALPGRPAPADLPAAVPPGVQAPVNVAPPGSPLVSPAGLGPGVPGTPIPQGLAPGVNLAPASPAPLPSLAHRAPALLPHAQAGNGLPDNVVTAVPAYEPRFGAGATGIAPGATTVRPDAGAGES
ncbi:cysteine desulfurase, partial [Bacillus gaemokensis]